MLEFDPRTSKVLVTGAAGFLGCHLVEHLVLDMRLPVRALIRNYASSGLPRLARLPVEVVAADVLDSQAIAAAVQGCDYIVHCVYGTSGDEQMRRRVTVEGTRSILEAGRTHSVKKIVHLSTSTVHGFPDGQVVDEESPYNYLGRVYYDSKIDAEKLVLKYHQQFGLPVSILRPTRIFGPWSTQFTLRIVEDIKNGVATLINGGVNKANLVYIGNVLEAIVLCLTSAKSSGETFLINGEEKVTWKQYYESYAAMMRKVEPFLNRSLEEIRKYEREERLRPLTRKLGKPWRGVKWAIRESYRGIPLLRASVDSLGSKVPQEWKAWPRTRAATDVHSPRNAKSVSAVMPELWRARQVAADFWVSNEKIKKVLGYQQGDDFQLAMDLTRDWLRWSRLI